MENSQGLFGKIKEEVAAIFGEKSKDRTYSSHHQYRDEASAQLAFRQAVSKLFDVDAWSELSTLTSTFELFSRHGERKEKTLLQVGDYIKITFPGPLPENWVVITDVQSSEEVAEFTVRPSAQPAPQSPDEVKEVKHFFTSESTSTFRVKREGATLEAFEIGQNEKVNNQGEEAGDRALVNTVVAAGGWAGMQAVQWNKLTDYLVHSSESQN